MDILLSYGNSKKMGYYKHMKPFIRVGLHSQEAQATILIYPPLSDQMVACVAERIGSHELTSMDTHIDIAEETTVTIGSLTVSKVTVPLTDDCSELNNVVSFMSLQPVELTSFRPGNEQAEDAYVSYFEITSSNT